MMCCECGWTGPTEQCTQIGTDLDGWRDMCPECWYKASEVPAPLADAWRVKREVEAEIRRWDERDEHEHLMVEDLAACLRDILWRAETGQSLDAILHPEEARE